MHVQSGYQVLQIHVCCEFMPVSYLPEYIIYFQFIIYTMQYIIIIFKIIIRNGDRTRYIVEIEGLAQRLSVFLPAPR